MPIPPLYAHEGIRHRLVGAIASGRLPQALLFEGPTGVGKQRLALWLAQALMCEAGLGEGCGKCQHCKLVLNLSHPDVHWFVPLELSKKGGDADKQVELVEEALGEEMAARRQQPLYQPPSGLASHGIAAVRLLLRRLVLTPAMGRRKVFVIGDAERLVPQTGAEAAANALLKALEEPPADTVLILTTAAPDALLPTILSRVVRVRVGRLGEGRGWGRAVSRGGGSRCSAPIWIRAWPAALPGPGRLHRHAGRPARAVARASAGRWRDGEGGRGDHPSTRSARPRPRECEPTARGGRIGRRPGGEGMKLSHVDEAGRARMVDVGDKPITVRTAVAEGAIRMSREAFRLVAEQQVAKGDVLAVSEVAGTLAAKRTAELIPLCHPLGLDHVEVDATLDEGLPGVRVRAAAKAVGRTGVEMEALTAVSVALLTVYDMVKAADRGMEIETVRLLEKTGGTRGDWRRDSAD